MKKNGVVLIGLFLLIIGLVMYNVKYFKKKGKPVVKPINIVEEQKIEHVDVKISTVKLKQPDDTWGRDPFYFSGEETLTSPQEEISQEQPISHKLEMIFMVNNKKTAIVNGKFVKEGDRIGEEVVAKIESDKILLKKNGRQRTIEIDKFVNPFKIEERQR